VTLCSHEIDKVKPALFQWHPVYTVYMNIPGKSLSISALYNPTVSWNRIETTNTTMKMCITLSQSFVVAVRVADAEMLEWDILICWTSRSLSSNSGGIPGKTFYISEWRSRFMGVLRDVDGTFPFSKGLKACINYHFILRAHLVIDHSLTRY
jgi:hypothetical protein